MNWTTQKSLTIKDEGKISLYLLHKLRLAGKKGITSDDFEKGYCLTKRISELSVFASIQRIPYTFTDSLGKHIGTKKRYVLDVEYPTSRRGFGTKGIKLRYHKGNLQYKVEA